MKDNLRESLSALMDNEGDELELRRVLKTADTAPDDIQAWRRYHLARSLMHRDHSIDVSSDISERVFASLKTEPAPQGSSQDGPARQDVPARSGGLSFAGSAAVAAAVSLMVITGVQFYNGGDSGTSPDMASSSADSATTRQASSGAGQGAQPASLSNGTSLPPRSVTELPAFRTPSSLGSGLMEVGADIDMPLFMAPQQRQSARAEREQARLLQNYLERHAEGAAHRSGEAWIPLLRASSQETLGSR
ncbi:sigma-E factor negative regulatory protein RseA [Modicisalibacter ilicicola DSM 19980]|uniref:Sigma-E factor negative regulatory protein RseA n=1 Tax=Modicisalibacter ilicicola DSM 19980 TaxID=1121942 RepID=A0A1M5D9F9_9GAMM|nr:sigma-E factor negative regulatory protein [Halomonas ilicicola]SHF63606.1 sigma-E factor negative regulatory protein RseA [Halomonas ilicicola DSM 19980]